VGILKLNRPVGVVVVAVAAHVVVVDGPVVTDDDDEDVVVEEDVVSGTGVVELVVGPDVELDVVTIGDDEAVV
jgi:hypothetical protein